MKTFSRAQITALVATVVDYGMTLFFAKVVGIYYLVSVALGALSGAISNFMLNRYWAFEAAHLPVGRQVFRYFLVSSGSLLINVSLVYLLTEHLHLYFLVSKVIAGIFVGLAFNYPLHRYFVYATAAEVVKETIDEVVDQVNEKLPNHKPE